MPGSLPMFSSRCDAGRDGRKMMTQRIVYFRLHKMAASYKIIPHVRQERYCTTGLGVFFVFFNSWSCFEWCLKGPTVLCICASIKLFCKTWGERFACYTIIRVILTCPLLLGYNADCCSSALKALFQQYFNICILLFYIRQSTKQFRL